MTGKAGNGNLHGRKYEYGPVIDGDSLSAHPQHYHRPHPQPRTPANLSRHFSLQLHAELVIHFQRRSRHVKFRRYQEQRWERA